MIPPKTMKVGLYFGNHDIRVLEQPIPEIGANEVLAKVMACGICGSDTMKWYRDPAAAREKNGINTGHEIAAEIAQTGENVRQFKTGDRVVVTHHFPCLQCGPCQDGNETACKAMHGKHLEPGGFSQYIRVFEKCVEHGLYPLPEGMSFEQGSFVEPLGCAVRSIRKTQPIEDHTVLVVGSGLAGLLHIKLARASGARKIYAVDTNEKRLDVASRCGADEGILAPEKWPPADRVFVCTGSSKAAESAMDCVNRGGQILFFAVDGPDQKIPLNLTRFWTMQPSICFSYGAAPRDMQEALEVIGSRKICVDDLVTHRLGIDQLPEAFDLVANPKDDSLKIIIEPNRE